MLGQELVGVLKRGAWQPPGHRLKLQACTRMWLADAHGGSACLQRVEVEQLCAGGGVFRHCVDPQEDHAAGREHTRAEVVWASLGEVRQRGNVPVCGPVHAPGLVHAQGAHSPQQHHDLLAPALEGAEAHAFDVVLAAAASRGRQVGLPQEDRGRPGARDRPVPGGRDMTASTGIRVTPGSTAARGSPQGRPCCAHARLHRATPCRKCALQLLTEVGCWSRIIQVWFWLALHSTLTWQSG